MADFNFDSKMSQTRVKVTDKSGAPVVNTSVDFNLKKHEFLFGCGAFDFVELFSDTDEERTKKYADRCEKWKRLFNYGTLPFYWGGYEPKEGDVKYESRRKAAELMISNGATVKGHPLCWHTACADWLLKYDNKTIMEKQLERINREVSAFKGVIDIWDAINETVIMPEFDRYDNAITRICNAYGRTTLIKEVFAAAHDANPNARFLINDFNLSDSYRKVIDECLEAGIKIDAIGLQSHQHQGYRGFKYFEDVLERFSVFGLPLHFTENTLISGAIMPGHIVDLNDYQVSEWPSTLEGEKRQAQEWEEMYNLLFSHPLVEAVTGWDFTDGKWLNAPSGILRLDNSEKPVYYKLHDMIYKKWSTCEKLTTDGAGYVTLKGYRGDYDVSVGSSHADIKLTKDATEVVAILK